MSVDIEVQLRTLGAHWDDTVAPVAMSEIVGTTIIEPETNKTRRPSRWSATRWALAGVGAAAALLVAVVVVRTLDHDDQSNTSARPHTVGLESFVGEWSANDPDGSTLRMDIVNTGGRAELTVHDTAASVCDGVASTMTGTGQVNDEGRLVIAAPVFTCDDGSDPVALSGPPLDEQLRNLSFTLDTADTMHDNLGTNWQRASADLTTAKSGGMWPQTSIEDVRQAQGRADAGDPAYTWQIDAQLASDEGLGHLFDPGAEIVRRFLQEKLGWEEFVFDATQLTRGPIDTSGPDGYHRGITFLRCAPGMTNPLYPPSSDQLAGTRCAPTIDDLRYETVTIDLSQPDRVGADGLWVVSSWRATEPFAQADPIAMESEATTYLENFLQARLAGESAESYLVSQDVPLLYTTTAGARYERFEVTRVSEPLWPFGSMNFVVRLFADGGNTIVEQPISFEADGWVTGEGSSPKVTYSYFLLPWQTTENGRPVPVPYELFDGTVIASVAAPLLKSVHFENAFASDDQALERVALTDASLRISCQPIPAAADAATLAAGIRSDGDLVVTSLAPVEVGGLTALQMDITLADGASACPEGRNGNKPLPSERVRGSGFPLEQGSRMRLYLVDIPDRSETHTVALAIVAPDAGFDSMLAATTSIIESVTFVAPAAIATGGALPDDLRNFLISEFGIVVEDAGELADAVGTLDIITGEIDSQRSDWGDDAEVSVYLARRTDGGGLVGTDQWPIGVAVWVIDVTNAGVQRGPGFGAVGRVVLVYDAETGENITEMQAAPE